MSMSNDLSLAESRLTLMREQLQCLLRSAWLPQFMLAVCGVLGIALLEHNVSWAGILAMAAAMMGLAGVRWFALRVFARTRPELLYYAAWRTIQLASNLLTGILAAVLMSVLLHSDAGWQQMLLLAMLVSIVISFWLASNSCILSFLCYVAPVALSAALAFFSPGSSAQHNLAVFFISLIAIELLAALRMSTLHASKLMLKQLLLQTREQRDHVVQGLQADLARLRTREQTLQLQVNSLQAHLEHSSSEQSQTLQQAYDKLRTSEERLQQALTASGLSLWDWDLTSGRVHHTGSEQLLGLDAMQAGEMLADLRPLMHPDDLPVLREAMTAHLRQETDDYHVEYRIRHADGHWVWIEDRGQAIVRDGAGRVMRMLGTRRDVSERRKHQDDLQLASMVFETSNEAIMVLDADLQILTTNQVFARTTGYERGNEQQFGKDLHRALQLHDLVQLHKELNEKGSWHADITGRRRSGAAFPLRLRLHAVRVHGSQQLAYVVAFFSDQTQFRETQKRLEYLARHDELTGLANRSLFHQRLQDASQQAGSVAEGLALLHIDLDRFKLLNECFGTETGDEVLRIVGRRLQRFACQQRSLARLGGNEFAMVVTEFADQAELEVLAEEVMRSLRAPFVTAGEELLLSVSIGISLVSGEHLDAHALLNRAGIALAHAKYMGGNTWQLYCEDMLVDGGVRLQLEQQLRRGLKEGHVRAHYQPKLSLQDNRIYSVEALARWYHPERGMISPVEFIPLAEETGLIGELTEIILHQACNQAKAWQDAGTPLQVSVNLSVQHLRQGNVLPLVHTALEDSGLSPHLLELELTESQLLDGSDRLLSTIADVRALGVQIAVDDFGTGYSSLGYLKQLPADCLKIDRSFIRDLSDSSQDAAITQAIITMAHGLSLQVVAEGVETLEQLAALRAMGCDAVQGFLIARPVPAEELQQIFEQDFTVLASGAGVNA